VLDGIEGVKQHAGDELGVSDWVTVTQDDVTTFARLTRDEQWIHVDPERARSGPFGSTVAHGFLTLSLATGLLWQVAVVDNVDVVLNYGLNRVRFPAPVRVGSRLRARVTLSEVRELDGGAEAVYHLVYEVEGEAKPPCVADLVFRYLR
jgi:acyl dehydratase